MAPLVVIAVIGLTAPVRGLLGATPAQAASDAGSCPWLAPGAGDASARAAQVVNAMTTQQKAAYLSIERNRDGYQNYIPAIPSLCLPSVRLEDGPAGIASGTAHVTQLPAPIALAATWDQHLAAAYGGVIGAEARSKGVTIAQAPMLNITRVPEFGRSFESFGEDPTLTAGIAVPEIRAIQAHGVIAEAKHLAANNQETWRRSINAAVSQRALREIYLPAFHAAVQTGRVGALMCAHNRINGVYACQSHQLLTTLARKEWGFSGLIRSDNAAVHDVPEALSAGDDVVKPLTASRLDHEATSGAVPMATLNRAVGDMLRVEFAHGLVTDPLPESPHAVATGPVHRAAAARVAEAGTVLLRNRPVGNRRVLPLTRRQDRSIAVIGPGASIAPTLRGSGSSHVAPSDVVTPLHAITKAAPPGTRVRYANGLPYRWSPVTVPAQALTPGGSEDGITETVSDAGGQVLSSRRVGTVRADFGTAARPTAPQGATPGRFSVTWKGSVVAQRTGRYRLQLRSNEGGSVSLGDRRVASERSGSPAPLTVSLRAGRRVPITVRYDNRSPGGSVNLVWGAARPPRASRQAAVRLAAGSQVAIVIADDNQREGADRTTLRLPSAQNALIEAVARANPRTVVVLDTGGAVLMPWLREVPAVLEGWYPGEMDGRALQAVLSGRVDPSGRLPLTFPASDAEVPTSSRAQWPGVHDTAIYSEGLDVGYRWYDAHRHRPLFPFGFGLSYTRFRLSHEHLTPAGAGRVRAGVTVRNTGARAGSDVVEVYLRYPAGAHEPPEQLRGFRKVSLRPGHSTRVRLTMPPSAFAFWAGGRRGWRIARGHYVVSVGRSSGDLTLSRRMPGGWAR